MGEHGAIRAWSSCTQATIEIGSQFDGARCEELNMAKKFPNVRMTERGSWKRRFIDLVLFHRCA